MAKLLVVALVPVSVSASKANSSSFLGESVGDRESTEEDEEEGINGRGRDNAERPWLGRCWETRQDRVDMVLPSWPPSDISTVLRTWFV
jgi:hypothetical protein